MNKLFYKNKELSREDDLTMYKFKNRDANGDVHLELKTYKELVKEKIKLKYDIDDELAIQRQKDEKPDEYTQYFDYVEQCKIDARTILEKI